ncbi:hypothetical protein PCIT_a4428 [Pseudoalteromonas citrea]|uniref:DUF2914 domain-containing protein n=2 Tax=Pseudoalteromonas citrea TaxID=43655 RepID=A0AAD4AFW4_9GAMM|nr:DUF2914 domain-containing protein [Pseudoalteromonas citrea]KAF7767526.1 hypothetical protein PCIT_a4428 [Pseudoalteromonas citrea]
MTQRIVIKTAVTKTAPTVQTVSYQWHWRRIFAVSGVVLLSAAGVTYGLTNAVNADEIKPQIPVNTIDEVTVASQSADETMSVEVLTLPVKQNRVDQDDDVAAVVATEDSDNSVAAGDLALAIEVVTEAGTAQDLESMTVETVEDIGTKGIQDVDQESTSSVSETVFSESAQVANVALGAKIDTNVVSRAVLTTGIAQREPIDVLKDNLKRTQFSEKLYFFTEIKNLQGKTIHHLWFHQDQLMAEIPLTVGAVRYRTYSSKNIMPSQTGQWRVEVVTQQGQLLAQKSFRIIPDAQ